MSTNSIMPADMSGRDSCRYFIVPLFLHGEEPRRSITLDPGHLIKNRMNLLFTKKSNHGK